MGKTINLSQDWEARLEHVAANRRRTPHAIMVEALETYIEQAERREQYLKEADASRTHFLETGRHITLKEAINWMETWGTKKSRRAPECHT